METLEKLYIFSKLNYNANLNIWANSTELSNISNDDYYYNFFGNTTYNLETSLVFNHSMRPNKKINVKKIKVVLHPSFSEKYYITCISLNKKTQEISDDRWTDILDLVYTQENEISITISVNNSLIIDTFYNINQIFRFYVISKLESFSGQASILSPFTLSLIDVFTIEIFGNYITNTAIVKNINFLSHNYYTINIQEYNHKIIISENQINSQFIVPMQISFVTILRVSHNIFYTNNVDQTNDNYGVLKTYQFGKGIIENVMINTNIGTEALAPILRVVGGTLSIYNIKNSKLADQVLNFVLEIHPDDLKYMPNPLSTSLYIYSDTDMTNPRQIIINSSNPIQIDGESTTSVESGLYNITGKQNYFLTTNNVNLFWTNNWDNLPILRVKCTSNIQSNKKISSISSDTLGYNFFNVNSNTSLNSGIRFNSSQGVRVLHNNILSMIAHKNLVSTYIPLNILQTLKIQNFTINLQNTNNIYIVANTSSVFLRVSPTNIYFYNNMFLDQITTNQILYNTIGSNINSGKITASQLTCKNITCNFLTNTSGVINLFSTAVQTNNIKCDFIIEKNLYDGTLTTANLNFTSLLARSSSFVLNVSSGSVTVPSVGFSDNVGILKFVDQNQNIKFYITDGSLQSSNVIFSIDSNKTLAAEKITMRNITSQHQVYASTNIKIAQGDSKSPSFILAFGTGLYQSASGQYSLSINRKNQLTISNNNSESINVLQTKKCTFMHILPTKLAINKGVRLNLPIRFTLIETGFYLSDTNNIVFVIANAEQMLVNSASIVVNGILSTPNNIYTNNLTVNNSASTDKLSIYNTQLQSANISEIRIPSSATGGQTAFIRVETNQGLSILFANTNCLYMNINGLNANNFIVQSTFTNIEPIILYSQLKITNNISVEYDNQTGKIIMYILGSNRLEILNSGIYINNNVSCQSNVQTNNINISTLLNASSIITQYLNTTILNVLTGTLSFNNQYRIFFQSSKLYFIMGATSQPSSSTIYVSSSEVYANNLTVNKNIICLPGIILVRRGTLSNLAVKFVSSSNTGLYQVNNVGERRIFLVVGGVERFIIHPQGQTELRLPIIINENIKSNSFTIAWTLTSIISTISSALTVNKNIKFFNNGTLIEPIIKLTTNSGINSISGSVGLYFVINFIEYLRITPSQTMVMGIVNAATATVSSITSQNLSVSGTLTLNQSLTVANFFSTPVIKFSNETGLYYDNANVYIDIKYKNTATNLLDTIISVRNNLVNFTQNLSMPSLNISAQNITLNASSGKITSSKSRSNYLNVVSTLLLKNLATYVKFPDSSRIYQSAQSKINFYIYNSSANNGSGALLNILEIGNTGAQTTYNIICKAANIGYTLSSTNINVSGIVSQSYENGNYVSLSRLYINDGSMSAPSILFKFGTGLFDSTSKGLNIIFNNTSIASLNTVDGFLRIANGISAGTLSNGATMFTKTLSVLYSQSSAGKITANARLKSLSRLYLPNGSTGSPALIMDGANLYYQQTSTKNIYFTIVNSAQSQNYFYVTSSGAFTDLNISQCPVLTCVALNSDGILNPPSGNSSVSTNTIQSNTLLLTSNISLANGFLSNNSAKFADGSGFYKSAGNLLFSNSVVNILSIGNSGLYIYNDLTLTNSAKTLYAQTVNATSISTTNSSSTNSAVNTVFVGSRLLFTYNSNGNFGFIFPDNIKINTNAQNEIVFNLANTLLMKMNSTTNVYTPNNITVLGNVSSNGIICSSISVTGGNATISSFTCATVNNINFIYLKSNGSAPSPALKFADNSGIFSDSTNNIGISVNGSKVCNLNTLGVRSDVVTSVNQFYSIVPGNRGAGILNISNGLSSNTGLWINDTSKEIGIQINNVDNVLFESTRTNFYVNLSILDSLSLATSPTTSASFPGIQNFYGSLGINVWQSQVINQIVGGIGVEGNTAGLQLTNSNNVLYISNGNSIRNNYTNDSQIVSFMNDSLLLSSIADPTVNNRPYIMTRFTGTKTIDGVDHRFGVRLSNTTRGNIGLMSTTGGSIVYIENGDFVLDNLVAWCHNENLDRNDWPNFDESVNATKSMYRVYRESSGTVFNLGAPSFNYSLKIHFWANDTSTNAVQIYTGNNGVNYINGTEGTIGSVRYIGVGTSKRTGPYLHVNYIRNRSYEFYYQSSGQWYMWMNPAFG